MAVEHRSRAAVDGVVGDHLSALLVWLHVTWGDCTCSGNSKFALRNDVVDLAIGVIIGAAFGKSSAQW
jgi:hypothetical protein